MELTAKEVEVLAWLASRHWDELAEEAETLIGINGLHRLAEKLQLETSKQ